MFVHLNVLIGIILIVSLLWRKQLKLILLFFLSLLQESVLYTTMHLVLQLQPVVIAHILQKDARIRNTLHITVRASINVRLLSIFFCNVISFIFEQKQRQIQFKRIKIFHCFEKLGYTVLAYPFVFSLSLRLKQIFSLYIS